MVLYLLSNEMAVKTEPNNLKVQSVLSVLKVFRQQKKENDYYELLQSVEALTSY